MVSGNTIIAFGLVVAFFFAGGSKLLGPAKDEFNKLKGKLDNTKSTGDSG